MKIGWIFPRNKKCGISYYSHAYIAKIRQHFAVEEFDAHEVLFLTPTIIDKINTCDCIHIQYEPSFFMKNRFEMYSKLCRNIRRPIIVTLHEVYEQSPFDFPREEITGSFLIRALKLFRYDLAHPYQTAYRRHLKRHFFAQKIVVHNQYQNRILKDFGIPASSIRIIGQPIQNRPYTKPNLCRNRVLQLGSTGFVNPTYDFDLLFQTLDALTIPWEFIWVGSAARAVHQETLQRLYKMIGRRNWEKKFIITGWLSNYSRNKILDSLDIYMALFTTRSNSGSLADALSARRPIITTDIPLTREINRNREVLRIVPSQPADIVMMIKKLTTDKREVSRIVRAQCKMCEENSYDNIVQSLINTYREVLTS
ncbi:MAG: glycosyltransferase [Chitinispirillaceae bacterium]